MSHPHELPARGKVVSVYLEPEPLERARALVPWIAEARGVVLPTDRATLDDVLLAAVRRGLVMLERERAAPKRVELEVAKKEGAKP